MYEIISNPKRHEGERVSFLAFYAPSFGRPMLFLDKERWLLSDTSSAIVVSEMTEEFFSSELEMRFSYVRVSGVVFGGLIHRIHPPLSMREVSMQVMQWPDESALVEEVLRSEANIGLTDEEYGRLIIEDEAGQADPSPN